MLVVQVPKERLLVAAESAAVVASVAWELLLELLAPILADVATPFFLELTFHKHRQLALPVWRLTSWSPDQDLSLPARMLSTFLFGFVLHLLTRHRCRKPPLRQVEVQVLER